MIRSVQCVGYVFPVEQVVHVAEKLPLKSTHFEIVIEVQVDRRIIRQLPGFRPVFFIRAVGCGEIGIVAPVVVEVDAEGQSRYRFLM